MNLADKDNKTVIVVGMLTKHECTALQAEHPDKSLEFYTTEEEVEELDLDLAFSWGMVSGFWCATPREKMPLYLEKIVDYLERLSLPVFSSLEHIE